MLISRVPIVGEADPFQLRFEFRDVVARCDRRMLAGLDRILFRGQSEGIPAHRMQNIAAAHAFVAREDIGRRVTLRMANMQSRAARIRKHVEDVKFRFRGIEIFLAGIRSVKRAALFPDGLPFRLKPIEWIRFASFAHQ